MGYNILDPPFSVQSISSSSPPHTISTTGSNPTAAHLAARAAARAAAGYITPHNLPPTRPNPVSLSSPSPHPLTPAGLIPSTAASTFLRTSAPPPLSSVKLSSPFPLSVNSSAITSSASKGNVIASLTPSSQTPLSVTSSSLTPLPLPSSSPPSSFTASASRKGIHKCIWEMNLNNLREWIKSEGERDRSNEGNSDVGIVVASRPSNILLLPRKRRRRGREKNQKNERNDATMGGMIVPRVTLSGDVIGSGTGIGGRELLDDKENIAIAERLLSNLITALESACTESIVDVEKKNEVEQKSSSAVKREGEGRGEQDAINCQPPPNKRTKIDYQSQPTVEMNEGETPSKLQEQQIKRQQKSKTMHQSQQAVRDIYNILDRSFARGNEVVHVPGAVIVRLTHAGLVNALAGLIGGVVKVVDDDIDDSFSIAIDKASANAAVKKDPLVSNFFDSFNQGLISLRGVEYKHHRSYSVPIPTAEGLTLAELESTARHLRRSASARMEMDALDSTSSRIMEMLCPELSNEEMMVLRKRVFDTVVLGRGTNGGLREGVGASGDGIDSDIDEDVPVVPAAARVAVHDIDKFKKCKVCGNNEQSSFVLDRKNGDLICTDCGTVAKESVMHEGSAFRKFEGEIDRNHHGDAPNPLYSNNHNMSTTLGGSAYEAPGSGAGRQGITGAPKCSAGLENILRNVHAYTEMNISQFGKGERRTRIGYKDRQKREAFIQMTHVGDALNLHGAVVQRAKELFAGFRNDREQVQQFKGVLAACLCEAFEQLSQDGKQMLKRSAVELDDYGTDSTEEDDTEKMSSSGDIVRKRKKLNFRANRRSELHSSSFAGKGGLLLNNIPTEKNLIEQNHSKMKENNGNILSKVGTNKYNKSNYGESQNKPVSSWDLDECRLWLFKASQSIVSKWIEEEITMADVTIPKCKDELEGELVGHTLTLCNMLENELNNVDVKVTDKSVIKGRPLGITWQRSHDRRPGGRRTAGQLLMLKTSKKLGTAIGNIRAGEAFHREIRAMLGREETQKTKDRSVEATQQRMNQMRRKKWLQKRLES